MSLGSGDSITEVLQQELAMTRIYLSHDVPIAKYKQEAECSCPQCMGSIGSVYVLVRFPGSNSQSPVKVVVSVLCAEYRNWGALCSTKTSRKAARWNER